MCVGEIGNTVQIFGNEVPFFCHSYFLGFLTWTFGVINGLSITEVMLDAVGN